MTSLNELLFHAPWWFPVLILAVGGFVFYSGNRRQEPRTRTVGALIMLLAGTLTTVSYLVDTDLEKAIKQSREVVQAVEARDWKRMEDLLDKHCSLSVLNSSFNYNSRDEIIGAAKVAVDRYGLKSAHITSIEGQQTNPIITVSFDALTEQNTTMGRPIPSGWQFEWIKTSEGLVLNRITNTSVANLTGTGTRRNFRGLECVKTTDPESAPSASVCT